MSVTLKRQVLPELNLGDVVVRLSPAATIEKALVIALEDQGTVKRYGVMSHRYGMLELSAGQPVRGKTDWQTVRMWQTAAIREAKVKKLMDEAQDEADKVE